MKRSTITLGLAALGALTFATLGCEGNIGPGSGESSKTGPSGSSEDPNYDPGSNDPSDDQRSLAFYYGPMKQMVGESIIYSISAITGHDFGTWDYTCPDPGTGAFDDAGNGNGDYYRHCRLLGGCMEHRIPLARTSFVGTAYVLELEKAITVACYDAEAFGMFPGSTAPGAGAQVIDIINHQYMKVFSVEPSAEDLELSIAYFESALADTPELEDMSAMESAGRGHCRSILSTSRFLFY